MSKISLNDLMSAHSLMQEMGINPAQSDAAMARRVAAYYRAEQDAADAAVQIAVRKFIRKVCLKPKIKFGIAYRLNTSEGLALPVIADGKEIGTITQENHNAPWIVSDNVRLFTTACSFPPGTPREDMLNHLNDGARDPDTKPE